MDAAMSKEHSESDLWGRAAVDLAAVMWSALEKRRSHKRQNNCNRDCIEGWLLKSLQLRRKISFLCVQKPQICYFSIGMKASPG